MGRKVSVTREQLLSRTEMHASAVAQDLGVSRRAVINAQHRYGIELPKGMPGKRGFKITSKTKFLAEKSTADALQFVPENLEKKVNRMAEVGHPPGVIADVCGITRGAVCGFLEAI